MQNLKRSRESGSTILELALVLPMLSLAFLGTTGLGLMEGRFVQAVQACRDVTHMYSDGIDFSQTQARNIALKLASGTGMTDAGGNGVIILSKITTVYQVDCTASGYSAGQCANATLPVFINRITIGKVTLRSGKYGDPDSSILDAQGNISNSVYMQNTNSTVRVSDSFEKDYDAAVKAVTGSAPTPPAMKQGDVVCLGEAYFAYPELDFLGWASSGGAYRSFIFHC